MLETMAKVAPRLSALIDTHVIYCGDTATQFFFKGNGSFTLNSGTHF